MLSGQVMQLLLELRRSFRTLRDSEALAQSAIDNNPDCTVTLDLEGRILGVNAAGGRMMQVADLAECYQRSWTDRWAGAHRDAALSALDKALSGGVGTFQEYCPAIGGAAGWWDVLVTPVRDVGGTTIRILTVSRDITSQRRMEDDLRGRAKLESLGVMAGGIAHDFNNLLTGILANASLLEPIVSDQQSPFVRQIVSAPERTAHLTPDACVLGKGTFRNPARQFVSTGAGDPATHQAIPGEYGNYA